MLLVSVLLFGDAYLVVFEDVMVFNCYAKIRWLSEGVVPLLHNNVFVIQMYVLIQMNCLHSMVMK